MNPFPERLRALRTDKGLSQVELAYTLGASTSCISMYEQGEREPSLDRLVALSNLFGVTVDYLIGKSDVRETDDTDAPKKRESYYTSWHRRKLKERAFDLLMETEHPHIIHLYADCFGFDENQMRSLESRLFELLMKKNAIDTLFTVFSESEQPEQ